MWWIQASNHFLHKPMDWEEWISYIGSMDEDPFYSLHVIYMVEALNKFPRACHGFISPSP